MKTKSRQNTSSKIINILIKYLKDNPEISFGKALFNINILKSDHHGCIEDIYNDSDITIYKRLKNLNL